MLGRKSETSPLPPPALPEEQEKWMYEKEVDAIDIDFSDLPQPARDINTSDPSLSGPDGPGHPDATPQQLPVISKIIHSLGI